MPNCPACGQDNPSGFKHCGHCGALLTPAATPLPVHELRKTVTVVFTDLKDSTVLGERLDSEALHAVKACYFQAMAAEIHRHGGKIEKYIGDALMAVFGMPQAREDDALRAVRAALGMRVALQRVNGELAQRFGVELAMRTGVNTGEVVTSDDAAADQKLVTGDAVNLSARLEAAAPADQIYIGETTYRLVRDAVEVESVAPLALKGKSQSVAAFRLLRASGAEGNARRIDTVVVGRDDELASMTWAFRQVAAGGGVHLLTLIGDAGVGKTRVVHEALARCGDAARVLRGRCLSYGEGVTFWPLRAMIDTAAGIVDADTPERARHKLLQQVGDVAVADRLASATGLLQAQFAVHDIYWAARRFFESQAAGQPVIAVIDDIHWAEPAFLKLIEHLLDSATGTPLLLLATARPELLERHARWSGLPRSTTLVLRPLADADAARVVGHLLGAAELSGEVLQRILRVAQGNPLYVEQILSMLIDGGALRLLEGRWQPVPGRGDITTPPTIQALIEARLDTLDRAERAAVEAAAVIGLEF
jgi:class 3 adenylate cyclase